MTDRYFEDYAVGSSWELGPVDVAEAEIIEFARRYDPQPFHLDAAAAAASPYGGIIASGWHTCAMVMRVLVEEYLSPASSLGSPGINELRWLRPVRPGDQLMIRASIADARVSNSKPDRGIVHTRVDVTNQASELVMHLTALNLLRLRPTA